MVKSTNAVIERYKPEFQKALANAMDVDRFMRILCTVVRQDENVSRIALNNPASLIGACMEIAQSGLDPSIPNEVSLIGYGNIERGSKTEEINCQFGYKGLAKLAMEAARDAGTPLLVLRQDTICENDTYERQGGDTPAVFHRYPPFGTPRGNVIGFVAVSKDANGQINFVEMTKEQVEEHKARFSRAKFGPFADPKNFNAYGLKTVLRLLVMRHLAMGPKLSRALAADIKGETGEDASWQVEKTVVPELPTAPKAIEESFEDDSLVYEKIEPKAVEVASPVKNEETVPPSHYLQDKPGFEIGTKTPAPVSSDAEFERIKARARKSGATV
jgi:recombination protein RecT